MCIRDRSTLFWAGIGLFFFGYPGAACLAVLHRSANVLDALWGKKNKKYIRFGTFAARLDLSLIHILVTETTLPTKPLTGAAPCMPLPTRGLSAPRKSPPDSACLR